MPKEYKTTFTVDKTIVDVMAKVWDYGNEETVDLWVDENGEHIWRNHLIIYSLKDAATLLRRKYKVKGLRIKWEPISPKDTGTTALPSPKGTEAESGLLRRG